MDVATIAAMLADRAPALAAELLPRGRREGNDWVEASRAKGGHGDSLRVAIAGPKRGVWHFFGGDFAGKAGGDMLDLVMVIAAGGSKAEAVKWAKAWLGLDGADRAALERHKQAAEAHRKTADAQAAREAARRRQAALRIWQAATHPIDGTPADSYLRGRGIAVADLGYHPQSLRFHPALSHPQTGQATHPALVALIAGADGKVAGVHRTFLGRRPDGSVGKLSGVDDAKLSLGTYRGGCIRLWRGADRTPFSKAAAGSSLLLVEGLEDGLTIALAAPSHRIAVTVSLSNLAALVLPPAYQHVRIAADNDPPGSPAAALLTRAVERFRREGRVVAIVRPPAGKDFNAMLTAREGAA